MTTRSHGGGPFGKAAAIDPSKKEGARLPKLFEGSPHVIVDLRIYTTRPGKLTAFLKLYKDHAWDLQQRYLGTCLGWYSTIEGPLNQVVHMWQYEDQADRERRRAAMAADPGWAVYLRASEEAGLLVSQENRFLRPTDFSPHR